MRDYATVHGEACEALQSYQQAIADNNINLSITHLHAMARLTNELIGINEEQGWESRYWFFGQLFPEDKREQFIEDCRAMAAY